MPSRRLAVVDSSFLFLLINPRAGETPQTLLRIANAEAWKQKLQGEGFEFLVPAPVVTELIDDGSVVAASRKAGAPITDKPRVKFDLMIAAIAHAKEAEYLIHANRNDFTRYFASVSSKVTPLDTDKPIPPPPGDKQVSFLPSVLPISKGCYAVARRPLHGPQRQALPIDRSKAAHRARRFGLAYKAKLSTRPENYLGEPKLWAKAEKG